MHLVKYVGFFGFNHTKGIYRWLSSAASEMQQCSGQLLQTKEQPVSSLAEGDTLWLAQPRHAWWLALATGTGHSLAPTPGWQLGQRPQGNSRLCQECSELVLCSKVWVCTCLES